MILTCILSLSSSILIRCSSIVSYGSYGSYPCTSVPIPTLVTILQLLLQHTVRRLLKSSVSSHSCHAMAHQPSCRPHAFPAYKEITFPRWLHPVSQSYQPHANNIILICHPCQLRSESYVAFQAGNLISEMRCVSSYKSLKGRVSFHSIIRTRNTNGRSPRHLISGDRELWDGIQGQDPGTVGWSGWMI